MGARFLLTKNLYLKVFIAFAIGILTVEVLGKVFWLMIPIGIFGLNTALNSYFNIRRSKFADNIFYSFIVILGILFHYFNFEYSREKTLESISNLKGQNVVFFIRADERPIEKANSYQVEGRILAYLDTDEHKLKKLNTKTIVYLAKDTLTKKSIDYGTILMLRSKFQEPRKAQYGFEFDYSRWLERRKIYGTLYGRDYRIVDSDKSYLYHFLLIPKRIRTYFEGEIDHYILDARSNAVAKSILIGIRSGMDRELIESYSDTGTIHILSVSGLHFSILMLLLSWILDRLVKPKRYRMVFKHGISFLYALITGFSPPVFRSFLMFFLIDIEKDSKVNPSIINIVFLSAWIILLFDSNQMFDIGFQLSYAAILGIILWQNKIEWKLQFDSFLMSYLWKSSSTLIAATIFTMPFVAYYFHKISFLGLLSNYLVIPLTLVSMYVGLSLLCFSWIDTIGNLLGHLLSSLILFQNNIILWFSHWNFASIDSIYLSKLSLILSLALLLALNLFLFLKGKYELRFILFFSLALVLNILYEKYLTEIREEWFHITMYKHTAYAHGYAHRINVFADSIEPNVNDFFLKSLRIYRRCKEDSIFLYPLNSRYTDHSMKFGVNLISNSEYLILCKENKHSWTKAIENRDSFILSSNLGDYYRSSLEKELNLHRKAYWYQ